ncbi:hypothetical protein [Haloactinomyces albus]|uniref:Uncharacterized protein n=1 Tax=Haloactinomyces albus TaxID=1352928 RepID=A0AAE4CQD8_9ACTN|nr:hypothetical protein [Haloactinomyces albus]MDR7302578.1 hypothetical protein [Haloactinomyces albus]
MAARQYLRQVNAEALTEHINSTPSLEDEDESARDAVHVGRRNLAGNGDTW